MTVRALPAPTAQLTLDFEPGVLDRFQTAMDLLGLGFVDRWDRSGWLARSA